MEIDTTCNAQHGKPSAVLQLQRSPSTTSPPYRRPFIQEVSHVSLNVGYGPEAGLSSSKKLFDPAPQAHASLWTQLSLEMPAEFQGHDEARAQIARAEITRRIHQIALLIPANHRDDPLHEGGNRATASTNLYHSFGYRERQLPPMARTSSQQHHLEVTVPVGQDYQTVALPHLESSATMSPRHRASLLVLLGQDHAALCRYADSTECSSSCGLMHLETADKKDLVVDCHPGIRLGLDHSPRSLSYAVLSHKWKCEEAALADLEPRHCVRKKGHQSFRGTCNDQLVSGAPSRNIHSKETSRHLYESPASGSAPKVGSRCSPTSAGECVATELTPNILDAMAGIACLVLAGVPNLSSKGFAQDIFQDVVPKFFGQPPHQQSLSLGLDVGSLSAEGRSHKPAIGTKTVVACG